MMLGIPASLHAKIRFDRGQIRRVTALRRYCSQLSPVELEIYLQDESSQFYFQKDSG